MLRDGGSGRIVRCIEAYKLPTKIPPNLHIDKVSQPHTPPPTRAPHPAPPSHDSRHLPAARTAVAGMFRAWDDPVGAGRCAIVHASSHPYSRCRLVMG